MADSAITTNFAKTGNILINLAAKLPFDNVVVIEQSGKTRDFVLFEILRTNGRINAGLSAKLARDLRADAVKVRQRDRRRTIIRNVNAQ